MFKQGLLFCSLCCFLHCLVIGVRCMRIAVVWRLSPNHVKCNAYQRIKFKRNISCRFLRCLLRGFKCMRIAAIYKAFTKPCKTQRKLQNSVPYVQISLIFAVVGEHAQMHAHSSVSQAYAQMLSTITEFTGIRGICFGI